MDALTNKFRMTFNGDDAVVLRSPCGSVEWVCVAWRQVLS